MNKQLPLETYNKFLEYVDTPTKMHLMTFGDEKGLKEYRVLRTQIETALARLVVIDKVEEMPTPNIIDNNDGTYGCEGADDLLFVSKFEWEKKLKALEALKELFDFDFAIRFGTNQPMIKITNKRTNEYWELPIPKDKYDLLKEVLL